MQYGSLNCIQILLLVRNVELVSSSRWSVTSLRGLGDRNFNAVSHQPTRAPILFNSICSRQLWFMGYGIKISFPRPPQWRHRSPGKYCWVAFIKFRPFHTLKSYSWVKEVKFQYRDKSVRPIVVTNLDVKPQAVRPQNLRPLDLRTVTARPVNLRPLPVRPQTVRRVNVRPLDIRR